MASGTAINTGGQSFPVDAHFINADSEPQPVVSNYPSHNDQGMFKPQHGNMAPVNELNYQGSVSPLQSQSTHGHRQSDTPEYPRYSSYTVSDAHNSIQEPGTPIGYGHGQAHETSHYSESSHENVCGFEQASGYPNGQGSHEYAVEQQPGYEMQQGPNQDVAQVHGNECVQPLNVSASFPTKPSGPNRKSSLAYRLWLWEIIASVFSIACVASIVAVLNYEQGKPLAQWQKGLGQKISPTVVVSFLGTIGKSSCLVAVAEIISQLKWLHFRSKARKLLDLQLFDNASRGPWGAFQLALVKNKDALLAVCAAVITIAALLIDPFIQLVFTFPSILTPATETAATIVASQVYDPTKLDTRFGQCYGPSGVDSVMQAAIISPVWNSARGPNLPCIFERCEWPTITTLGVCSNCSDVTDTVVPECAVSGHNKDQIQCNYTIPTTNNTFYTTFAVTGGAAERLPYQPLWNSTVRLYGLNGSWLFDPTESEPARISRFSSISFAPNLPWQSYIDHSNKGSPSLTSSPAVRQAMECSFDLCARTFTEPYYANFSAGPLAGPQTPLVVTHAPVAADRLIGLGPSTSDHPAMNTTFLINACDYKDLVSYFGDLFSTQYSSPGAPNATPSGQAAFTGGQSVTPNIGVILSNITDIRKLAQDMADSMTEAFRTSANSTTYDGTGMNTVVFISITWAWMALPIAVVALTFIMLVVVIICNNARGIPTWKSSSLALLFHDLEGWDRSELGVSGPEDLTKRASNMSARVINEGAVPLFSRDGS